jgi:dihydrofolate reductase
MRKLLSFMVVTLDGYYEGPNGEFDWPNVDAEFNEFSISQLNDIETLLFGRVTYEGMASYWPTPAALEFDPVIAERMNNIHKVVFSKSLTEATWQNSTLTREDIGTAVPKLKEESGGGALAIFGSPTLTVSLLEAGLVDELRVMVMPILLGAGKSLFTGLRDRVHVKLGPTIVFSSGNVLLTYQPTTRPTA